MSQSDFAPTRRYSIPHGFVRLRHSLSPPLPGRQCRGTLSPVPYESSLDWAHVACMPDTAWPIDGHPPGLSRSFSNTPVLMSANPFRHFHGVRLPAPYLTHQVRLFPHRSPRQASTNAACGRFETTPRRAIPGGLPPSFVQFRLKKLTYKLPSATGHNGDWASSNPAFHHIARVPRRTAPYAWTRPPVSWHAVVPEFLHGSR